MIDTFKRATAEWINSALACQCNCTIWQEEEVETSLYYTYCVLPGSVKNVDGFFLQAFTKITFPNSSSCLIKQTGLVRCSIFRGEPQQIHGSRLDRLTSQLPFVTNLNLHPNFRLKECRPAHAFIFLCTYKRVMQFKSCLRADIFLSNVSKVYVSFQFLEQIIGKRFLKYDFGGGFAPKTPS